MGNGILFVVIVALWAVILVPIWLRSHDAATETKSVDRFSTAMRSLSRRGNQRDLLVPGAPRGVEISGGRAPSAAARRARARELQTLRRRRSIVCALGGLLGVLLLAALTGAVSWLLPAVVLLGAAGYLANLRIQAVQAAERERRRRRAAARAARPVARPAAAGVRAADAPSVAAPAVATEPVEEYGGSWEATPVVLPTYVTAPPATSVPRMIDLTHPGAWSAEHMLAAAARRADPDEIFDRTVEPAQVTDEQVAAVEAARIEAEHDAVAASAGGGRAGFADDDVIFDQYDESTLLDYLDRRAVND